MKEVRTSTTLLLIRTDCIAVQQILDESFGYANHVDRHAVLHFVTLRTVLDAVKQVS
jgi:hypothetical protein